MKDVSYFDDVFVRKMHFIFGTLLIIISDELQIFDNLVNVHLTRLVRPTTHKLRVKDGPQAGLIDNHSFRLLDFGNFLNNSRYLFLDYRRFWRWLFLDHFRLSVR